MIVARVLPRLLGGIGAVALVVALLLATAALAAPSPPPAATPVPAAVTGRALFSAKGCAACHAHAALGAEPHGWIGAEPPDLTRYRNDPAFLRAWLANPSAARPGATMPDLDLAPAEIDALIAFLNSPEPAL